jgi:hypothetical protein
MANHAYVDNSNYFIEGQRASAVKKGMALNFDDAFQQKILESLGEANCFELVLGCEALPLTLCWALGRFSCH